jgi:hypothetical protein
MSSVLEGVIPEAKNNDCIEVKPVYCGEIIVSDNTDTSFKIEFPKKAELEWGNTLPLSGGAIVSIGVKDLKLQPNKKVDDIITKKAEDLAKLTNLNNNLTSLSKVHVAVNNILFDISKKNFRNLEYNRKAPNIYFCIYNGQDSSTLQPNVFSPDVIRICEFKYIPFEVFPKIIDTLFSTSGKFFDTVGISGRRFDEINLGDNNVVDYVLEFFPVINISQEDLFSTKSNPILGGYYTIKNDRVYIKMPDLTGRNSAGEVIQSISSEDEIFIEIISEQVVNRIKIEAFKPPPLAAITGEIPDNFPLGSDSVTFNFELLEDEDVDIYISPINVSGLLGKTRFLKTFDTSIEYTSVPVLTLGLEEGRAAVVNEKSIPSSKDQAIYSKAEKYLPGISSADPLSDLPYTNDVDPYVWFGIKNRPDILLSNNGVADNKNEGKYYNPASYGAINLLASVTPKIYLNTPSKWIKKTPIKSEDETYQVTISASDLSSIDVDGLAFSVYNFILYAADKFGQVTKFIGPVISLQKQRPTIDEIIPNGFDDSSPIAFDIANNILIKGENLDCVNEIIFRGKEDNKKISLQLANPLIAYTQSTQEILIIISPNTLQQLEFTPISQRYGVTLKCPNILEESNEEQIYISTSIIESRPPKGTVLAQFNTDDIVSLDFGTKPIIGIPLFKNGSSAVLRLKSKNKIFKGDKKVYAYLALPNSNASKQILHQFSMPEENIEVNTSAGTFLVSKNIKYDFSASTSEDFFKVSNKKANLRFPGKNYRNYNFSGLQSLREAYFIFTNISIDEMTGSETKLDLVERDNTSHAILRLGSNEAPAFIEPATVLGIAVEKTDTVVSSTFEKTYYSSVNFSEYFGNRQFILEAPNTFKKIRKVVLIVSGIKERFLRKRYTIKLGDEVIKRRKIKSAKHIEDGGAHIIFEIDNFKPSNSGILTFSIDKKEKIFGSNYSMPGYYTQGTAITKDVNNITYSIDELTGEVTTNLDISSTEIISDLNSFLNDPTKFYGFIGTPSGDATNVLEAVYPDSKTDGLIFNPAATNAETSYNSFLPFDITPSTDLRLKINGEDKDIFSLLPYPDVNSLDKKVLVLPGGAIFLKDYYRIYDKNILLFFNILNSKLPSIKHNVSEVVGIGPEDGEIILLDSGTPITIVAEKLYKIKVVNSERDFVILLNDIPLYPRGRPILVDDTPGSYIALVQMPPEVTGFIIAKDCFDVCASTTNTTREGAKINLGGPFTVDIAELYDGEGSAPDIEDLADKASSYPLQFVQEVLDKSLTPRNFIKSFCDFSFHLAVELKVSLNGFKTLMVPVKVIFCIIDVICSLLNPVKIAKAVIRLFESLWDLILILPQFSVPVMFLRLVLHLLELFKCLVDKVNLTITAINEICKAISDAAKTPINFTAIKSLEETLSEYLFEIKADISILEPVLSIFSLFLELLQLTFRFPCNINPNGAQQNCGVDGTMIAGIVAGIVAPELEIIPDKLLPVAQTYSTDTTSGSTSAGNIVEPNVGNVVANNSGQTYLESLNIEQDSLRANSNLDFNPTMAPTFTKSSKKGGLATEVNFTFKSRGLSTTLNSKSIDLNQTVDSPIALFTKSNDNLLIAQNGNIFSPVDGEDFLDINLDTKTATVKPLILNLEIPILTTDPQTGVPTQTGVDIVTRTFDNIPKLVILDDGLNVYFINKDGIKFNDDGFVESIEATIINASSAPKQKFQKEEVELDTDGDPSTDDGVVNLFDFPQLYFFDMRQAAEQLEQFCSTASINNFPFEDNNVEDIKNIVSQAQGCVTDWKSGLLGMVNKLSEQRQLGILPLGGIEIDTFEGLNSDVNRCLEKAANDICKYAVSSLNTSLKILEDQDQTPLAGYVDGTVTDEILENFVGSGAAFTGAREYAAGIGDSVKIKTGSVANIEIIPRDAYDNELGGDFSSRILVEIISDQTNSAKVIKGPDNNLVTKNGGKYLAKVTSEGVGEVKIRAKICDRTIQAITYSGITISEEQEATVDCIPDNQSIISTNSPPLGALTKVDRILSVYFIDTPNQFIPMVSGDITNNTNPQEFGTRLEN